MLNDEQLKITARALDYLLANADLSKPQRQYAEAAAGYIDGLINGDIIASYWTIDDVKSLQDDEDEFTEEERITDEEARQVLKAADVNHDATIGINWDVLREHLDIVRSAA